MKEKPSTCPLVTDSHRESSGIFTDHLKIGTCSLLGQDQQATSLAMR